MLLKYTLNNIFSKPGRLIIIMICMSVACCAAFVAVDFGSSMKGFLQNMIGNLGGTSDYIATYRGADGITDETFAGMPECRYVGFKGFTKLEYRRDEKQYSYVMTDSVSVYTYTDAESAVRMELIPKEAVCSNGQIAIGKRYSEKYGYKIGDTIFLEDTEQNEYPFIVSGVYEEATSMSVRYMAVITAEDFTSLRGEGPFTGAYIDVVNNEERDGFKERMTEEHPNVALLNMFFNEDQLRAFDEYAKIVFLIFVLVFVLVIFVMVGFTEKIITERMSVIGTLRSIGMSMRKTTFILLFENVVYGVAGSILGFILYLIVRVFGLSYMSSSYGISVGDVKITWPMIPVVILGAVLIQVLIPVKEVLKAVNTPIRDIIFDTRDSEYKISIRKTVTGALCIVLGLILGFSSKIAYVSGTGVLLIIVGAAFSIQFIVRKLTLCLSGVFGKRNMPVAELAAAETGSKKPNSGNAVLTVASVSAAAAIFVIVNSVIVTLNKIPYDADIVVAANALKTAKYDYLQEIGGVSDLEFIYEYMETIKSLKDDHEYDVSILSLPAKGMYRSLGELPSELGKYEMLIDEPAANKMGLAEGETVEIVFHSSTVFPIKQTLTVKMITAETAFASEGTLVISRDLYKELFIDKPALILIKADDTAAAMKAVEPTFTSGEYVQTLQGYIKETKKQSRKLIAAMIAVLAASIAMTLIGISGNQLIGFAARKKEYAMLHSCACSQSKIIRLILAENAMLFGISCIVAGIICVPVSILISRILRYTNLGIYIDVRYNLLILCIIALWLITMLTSLSPINHLKKMNTAMELKYE